MAKNKDKRIFVLVRFKDGNSRYFVFMEKAKAQDFIKEMLNFPNVGSCGITN